MHGSSQGIYKWLIPNILKRVEKLYFYIQIKKILFITIMKLYFYLLKKK
jgi:hypothetical protein